ncbi:MAG: GNAT family N-acetyltransferase [Chlorobiales bacterium]|nr:GNAT family N-acetyltransferase [Chlorobiales bacterium]
MFQEKEGTGMHAVGIRYQLGVPESCLAASVSLYDEAFGQKFKVAIRSDQQRLSLLKDCFKREYAIVAMAGDKLVGIAGFHTPEGSFTGGVEYKDMVSLLGFIEGSWAALILSLYDRKPETGELLMDGIAVHRDYRGKGIGRRLLEELAVYAREEGYDRLRLDVIDTNSGARKLYERVGFKPIRTERFAYLRWFLGFGGSTTMVLNIEAANKEAVS